MGTVNTSSQSSVSRQLIAMTDLKERLNGAAEEASMEKTESTYRDIITGSSPNDAESVKIKEEALQKLCDLKIKQEDAPGLKALLSDLRPLFAKFPKAKTAKMVRNIIDAMSKVPDSTQIQVKVFYFGALEYCAIAWCDG